MSERALLTDGDSPDVARHAISALCRKSRRVATTICDIKIWVFGIVLRTDPRVLLWWRAAVWISARGAWAVTALRWPWLGGRIAGKKPGRVFCVTSASPGLVVPWGDRDAVDLVLAR